MRFISVIVSVVLVAAAIFALYQIAILVSNISDSSVNNFQKTTTNSPPSEIMECNDNVTIGEPCFGLVMITRNEWLAQPPHNSIGKLDIPAKRIILTDTQTGECTNRHDCILIVRLIQEEHLLINDDIAFNFLINTQGDVYAGRGWAMQSAEIDDVLRMDSYSIAFIGNFTELPPWDKQVKSLRRFVDLAVSVGKLNASSSIYCSKNIILPLIKFGRHIGTYKECLNTN